VYFVLGAFICICLSTCNIIADVRHVPLYECTVRGMRKKLSSVGGNSGIRNANEVVVVPVLGSGGA
jgi:hypothetical protein